MPWKKITKGKWKGRYISPSGRVYTLRQIRAYYATGRWSRPVRKKVQSEGL